MRPLNLQTPKRERNPDMSQLNFEPTDPNAKVTVHDPDGNPVQCSIANAHDFVRLNGYYWTAGEAKVAAAVVAAEAEATAEQEPEATPEAEATAEQEPEATPEAESTAEQEPEAAPEAESTAAPASKPPTSKLKRGRPKG